MNLIKNPKIKENIIQTYMKEYENTFIMIKEIIQPIFHKIHPLYEYELDNYLFLI